jgi:hypothetical protein
VAEPKGTVLETSSSTPGDASSALPKASLAEAQTLDSTTTEAAKSEIASPPAVDGRASVATAEGDRELQDAIWVEGRVVIPDGTPLDEHIEILADGGKFKSRPPHRVSLSHDGTFRIAFPKDAKNARVNLAARYLYLSEPTSLKLSSVPKGVVLEPRLGSRIHGHLVLPIGVAPDAPPLTGTRVVLSRKSNSDTFEFLPPRESTLDANLEFEFAGVPVDDRRLYEVSIEPPDFVEVSLEDLQPRSGRTEELEIKLLIGARIAGRVVDEAGKGVSGAHFMVSGEKKGGGFAFRTSHESSTDDGSFTLPGIPPGKMTVEISSAGFEVLKYEAGDLADGETKDHVEIVLHRGLVVSGRIQWPDGTPVAGCPIAVEQNTAGVVDPTTMFRDNPPNATKEDGSFDISGFTDGTLTLTAEVRVPETDAPAHSSGTRGGRTWIARVEKVKPGTVGLLLTLAPTRAIAGRAVDDTGKPVPVFTVRASPAEQSDFWPMQRGVISQYFRNKSGEFTLDGLHDGEWNVSASGKGYSNSETRRLTLPGDDAAIDLVLPRPATISGVIVDPSGHPVGKAVAHAAKTDGNVLVEALNELKRFKADKDGRFELKDLPVGRVKLSATAEGWADSEEILMDLHAADVLADVKLSLRAGGTIEGKVLGSGGQPDPRRPIELEWAQTRFEPLRRVVSDDSGRFQIEHVLAGRYVLTAQRGEHGSEGDDASSDDESDLANHSRTQAIVTVVEGETTHVVLGAPPSSPVVLFGVIRSGDRAVADIGVQATLAQGAAELDPKIGKSDAQGRYELTLDEPGEYTITLHASGSSSAHRVVVPAQARFEQDLVLPAGRIAGRVLGPDGKPVAEITVSLLPDEQKADLVGQLSYGDSETDAEGRFAFENLSSGTYSIEAGGPGAWLGGNNVRYGRAVRDGLIVTDGGRIENADLKLPPACQVEGIVLGPGGTPVGEAIIFARDASGHVEGQPFTWKSDASGHFRLEGVSPGRTTFFARTESMASAESAPVSISERGSGSVELVVVPATILRVQVENRDHQPAASEISVLDEHGHEFGGTSMMFQDEGEGGADAAGGLSIGPLPPGRYQVSAHYGKLTASAQEVSLSGEPTKSVIVRLGS